MVLAESICSYLLREYCCLTDKGPASEADGSPDVWKCIFGKKRSQHRTTPASPLSAAWI